MHFTLPRNPHVRSREAREIIFILTLLTTLLLFGTLGFAAVEGWSLFDSLYMTMITITTVGFQEVHPLSNAGRAFSIALIMCGVGTVTFCATTLARKVVERQVQWAYERKTMKKIIESCENHTVFCGYGRLSRLAIDELKEADDLIVVVDNSEERAREAEQDGLLVIKGDATVEETLTHAGVARAKRLVSLLHTDAENLYVILAAKELNPDLYVLTRAEDNTGEKRLRRAGANRIVAPYRVGGQKIADGLLRPYVTDFLDLASSGQKDNRLQIEEICVPQDSPLVGESLEDAGIRKSTNVIIVAVIPESGDMRFNPPGTMEIEAGSTLIGMGLKEEFTKLEQLLLGE